MYYGSFKIFIKLSYLHVSLEYSHESCINEIALYPGHPMFFDVACEKVEKHGMIWVQG